MSSRTSHDSDPGVPPGALDSGGRSRSVSFAFYRSKLALVVVLALLLLAIVGFAWFRVALQPGSSTLASQSVPYPNQAAPQPMLTPQGYQGFPFAVMVGSNERAPVVQVWEDFQCVKCRELHAATFPQLSRLAERGKIRLALRPVTVLDSRQPSTTSLEATAAWGCAIEAGKALEYRSALFASHSPARGTYLSAEDFVGLARSVGLSGVDLAQFESCLALGTYRTWAINGLTAFFYESIPRLPWLVVDGEPVDALDAPEVLERLGTLE